MFIFNHILCVFKHKRCFISFFILTFVSLKELFCYSLWEFTFISSKYPI